jgi:DNA mismatch repair protein MutS
VPDNFERKQTLVNAERFVTEELKNHEVEILSAKSRQIDLERELFVELKNKIVTAASRIQLASSSLAVIDALCSFAYLAREHNYSKPEFSETDQMLIEQGRHPVIERVIGQHNFVSNDSKLDTDYRRFAILTGPNMGGKSTYLRQVGLIQLLAQAGSFVPAKRAQLSIVDRIFTRIGTSDDLARGDSTFMVEMREVATIVRKATSKSLVLIDEVGRGTATADGFSIATAIAEWLHDTVKCKTIFATHFHELTELTASKEGMFCLAVGIIEKEHNIVFTHKIMEEISDRSYGIEVAKLAGLPIELIDRARDLLDSTSREVVLKPDFNIPKKVNDLEAKPVVDFSKIQKELSEIDPNSLSPYQALGELIRLKELTKFNQK